MNRTESGGLLGGGIEESVQALLEPYLLCFCLTAPCRMQDLSSPSRNQTGVPCIGSLES